MVCTSCGSEYAVAQFDQAVAVAGEQQYQAKTDTWDVQGEGLVVYECKNCGHQYVPKYSSVYMAKHIGRIRKMTCPKCHKKSWQKKVV